MDGCLKRPQLATMTTRVNVGKHVRTSVFVLQQEGEAQESCMRDVRHALTTV